MDHDDTQITALLLKKKRKNTKFVARNREGSTAHELVDCPPDGARFASIQIARGEGNFSPLATAKTANPRYR